MGDDGPSPVTVAVEAGDWTRALGDPVTLAGRAVTAARRATVSGALLESAEVSVLLTDDRTVRALNARWRGFDQPTNVLSFPTSELTPSAWPADGTEPALLGDIVLAFETISREAAAEGRPIADHVCHLVVHGTLHLLGYDHQHEADALVMEDLERLILGDLGVGDPYPLEARDAPEMAR